MVWASGLANTVVFVFNGFGIEACKYHSFVSDFGSEACKYHCFFLWFGHRGLQTPYFGFSMCLGSRLANSVVCLNGVGIEA